MHPIGMSTSGAVLAAAIILHAVLPARAGLPESPWLFHAGTRVHLEENVAAKNVPQKAWDDFIMGKTNFDLPEYRKGLYGAERLSETNLYSLYKVLAGREPWVMMIRVADSCLTAERMQPGGYHLGTGDPRNRFERWYSGARGRYRHLERRCAGTRPGVRSWEEGALYDLRKASLEEQNLTRLCTPVLQDYLDENRIAVVYDPVNDGSWYVRERSCIADIIGTPDQLFKAIFENEPAQDAQDLQERLLGDGARPGTYFAGGTIIALKVLAETTRLVDARALLESSAVELDRPRTRDDALSLDSNGDNGVILARALRAAARAARDGNVQDFQKRLRGALAALTAALGDACRSQNGVPSERRAACADATVAQTALLLSALEADAP